MLKDNSVIFKGGKTGIIVLLEESADFKHIAAVLRAKIRDTAHFFDGASTSISFKGKTLTDRQLLNLLDIINEEININITFVEDLTGGPAPQKVFKPMLRPVPPANLYTHASVLRSGQAIRHEGCVSVIGDVNAGAEIVAAGNIVVFGTVYGMVHAGADGNKDAFICALSMQPIQLRIANLIIAFDKETKQTINKLDPMYAFIKEGEICIERYLNSTEEVKNG